MTLDEQQSIYDRVEELTRMAHGEATAAALLLLGDRVVGVLDGILSRLRAIADHLESIDESMP